MTISKKVFSGRKLASVLIAAKNTFNGSLDKTTSKVQPLEAHGKKCRQNTMGPFATGIKQPLKGFLNKRNKTKKISKHKF